MKNIIRFLLYNRFAYEKIRSTALWMLVGRGNLKDTDEEDLPPTWILDKVTLGGNTVVCKRKPKLQHLLMCHITAQGMELRMQEGDATQSRKFLDNSINAETDRYVQFSDIRKQLINTSMVAKSGMVLHGIAFSKHLQLTNSECSWALDMRYQKVIGRYQSIMKQEKKHIGHCPNAKPHRGRGITRAKDKGGRCLNTCFSNNQNLLHDSVTTHLSKALHGGDLRVFKQEDQPFPTINRRTDITVTSLDNLTKPVCYFDATISNKTAESSNRPKTIKLADKDHTDCCPQMNASYVRDNYLYRATSLSKNGKYAKARKENYDNGDRSISPTIYPFGMNTQGGFCDLAVLSLKQMANKKFKNCCATKRKADWLKAQWVNETCRDLQAKVIKTAAFCHNRALRDLYPDSYRLLFTTGSFTPTASPFSSEPDVQHVQRTHPEG